MNKKIGAGLLMLGLVAGGGAVVAKQIHAQSPTNAPIVASTPVVVSGDIQTAGDTDNIQDAGGIEKPDKVISTDSNKDSGEHEGPNDTDGGANEDAD